MRFFTVLIVFCVGKYFFLEANSFVNAFLVIQLYERKPNTELVYILKLILIFVIRFSRSP